MNAPKGILGHWTSPLTSFLQLRVFRLPIRPTYLPAPEWPCPIKEHGGACTAHGASPDACRGRATAVFAVAQRPGWGWQGSDAQMDRVTDTGCLPGHFQGNACLLFPLIPLITPQDASPLVLPNRCILQSN